MHSTGQGTRNACWRALAATAPLVIACGIAARAYGQIAVPAALTTPAEAAPAPAALSTPDQAAVPAALLTPTEASASRVPVALEPVIDVRQWKFKYRGPGVKAEGVVTTLAQPLPDGTFQIVAIEGKRNRAKILALEPSGELVTWRGHLFSDNHLVFAPPYLNESGFSYQIGHGRYYNICYAGPEEGCGTEGYQEFDYRSTGKPVKMTMEPLGDVTHIPLAQLDPILLAPPTDQEPANETPCEPEKPSLIATALSWLGFGAGAAPAAASNDLTCQPKALSIKGP